MPNNSKTTWQNFVDGEWLSADPDQSLPVINPTTEKVLGYMPSTSADQVSAAVETAHRSFDAWKSTPPAVRGSILRRAAALMRERVDQMALPIAIETGKPIAQARGEIEGAAKYVDWFAEEARRLNGELLRERGPGQIALVSHEPVGVVGALTAWNFPISLTCRKAAPALAAGCPVIIRPAVEGSGSLRTLIECFVEAGTPSGVLQLLLGDGPTIGASLMENPLVRKISFTGSVPVGQQLIQQSAETVKVLSMELGGHAPFIVFEDMDGKELGRLAAQRKFANAGQICISPGRFFVHSKVYDAFVESFVATTKTLCVGDPLNPETQMGPLVNKRRQSAIESMIDNARASGELLCGGEPTRESSKGYFTMPAVVTGIGDDHPLMREEIFGPIAPIVSFETEEEVLMRANSSELGLAAFAFTHNLARAHRVSNQLEAGIVAVNTMTIGMPEAPFGGVKQSGYGREGGTHGVMSYMQPKLTLIQYESGLK